MYESPAFDTSDDFMRSVFKENISKKDGFVVEESNIGKEENFGEFKISISSDEKVVVSEVESSRLENCKDCWRDNKQKKQPSNKVFIHESLFSFLFPFFHNSNSTQCV